MDPNRASVIHAPCVMYNARLLGVRLFRFCEVGKDWGLSCVGVIFPLCIGQRVGSGGWKMKGGSSPALRLQKRVLFPVLLCRFCAGAGGGGV